MEQKMTVQDAIFSFQQEIGFALEDKNKDYIDRIQNIRDYANFLLEIAYLDADQEITVHESPMGGFYYTTDNDEYEGEI